MGNGSLDCGDAGAYDTFEWGQVLGTKVEVHVILIIAKRAYMHRTNISKVILFRKQY